MRERPDAAAAAAAPSTPVRGAAAPEQSSKAAQDAIQPISAEALRRTIRAGGKKATLVNAWASWCGPCRREVPMLQALSVNLEPQSVQVLLVTVDEPKDAAKAAGFLKDNGITLKSYIVDGEMREFKAGINPRWPGMLPASFLFDSSGDLVHFWGGEAFESEIVGVVEAFLAGRPIEAETRYGLAPGKVDP